MSKALNIIFAGTPDFAAAALQACLDSEHRVVAVFTQPDRPAGRGRKIKFGPVKQLAVDYNIPVYQPIRLEQEQCSLIENLQADLMLVSAYGLLLPVQVLSAPRLGCINIHASLLPSWRGAAPIQRAIIAGDQESGLSIMQMEEGLDSGPVLQQFKCDITAEDTGSSLHDRLANMSATEIIGVLNYLEAGKLTGNLQDESRVSYAKKITKQETNIDWHQTAKVIERKIRAFNAWPVAHTFWGQQRVRIWQAELCSEALDAPPGTILVSKSNKKNTMNVVTGQGVLRITTLQLAGSKAIQAQDFLNAYDVHGDCFRTAPSNLTKLNAAQVSA